jgi:hypothetical protein
MEVVEPIGVINVPEKCSESVLVEGFSAVRLVKDNRPHHKPSDQADPWETRASARVIGSTDRVEPELFKSCLTEAGAGTTAPLAGWPDSHPGRLPCPMIIIPTRCRRSLPSRGRMRVAGALVPVLLRGSPASNAREPASSPFLSGTPDIRHSFSPLIDPAALQRRF